MNLLIIFTIGIQAIDSSYTFKAEKYCSGKSSNLWTGNLPLVRIKSFWDLKAYYCVNCKEIIVFKEGTLNQQRACKTLIDTNGCCERYFTRALSKDHVENLKTNHILDRKLKFMLKRTDWAKISNSSSTLNM